MASDRDTQPCDCGTCQAIVSARAVVSDRDTLIELIDDTRADGHSPSEAADYLLDAGVRPPAREITTAAEADALPVGSMVVDVFAAGCTRIGADPVFGWVRATSALKSGRQYGGPHLPATVLYVPTEEARDGN